MVPGVGNLKVTATVKTQITVLSGQWRSQLGKRGGSRGPSPPINPPVQTKHKHTYKLHKICQFGQFIFGKIIKIVATRSHLLKLQEIWANAHETRESL